MARILDGSSVLVGDATPFATRRPYAGQQQPKEDKAEVLDRRLQLVAKYGPTVANALLRGGQAISRSMDEADAKADETGLAEIAKRRQAHREGGLGEREELALGRDLDDKDTFYGDAGIVPGAPAAKDARPIQVSSEAQKLADAERMRTQRRQLAQAALFKNRYEGEPSLPAQTVGEGHPAGPTSFPATGLDAAVEADVDDPEASAALLGDVRRGVERGQEGLAQEAQRRRAMREEEERARLAGQPPAPDVIPGGGIEPAPGEPVQVAQPAAVQPPAAPAAPEAPQPEPAAAQRKTLGTASDAELATAARRLEAGLGTMTENHPNATLLRRRLDAVKAEQRNRADAREAETIQGRVAERAKTGTLEMEEVYARARAADTPEAQAAVLRDLSRARIPLTIEGILSGNLTSSAAAEVKALFPTGRDLTAESTNANLRAKADLAAQQGTLAEARAAAQKAQADLANAKSESERALLQDRANKLQAEVEKLKADADRGNAQAYDIAAQTPGKVENRAADTALKGTQGDLNAARAADIRAKTQSSIDVMRAKADNLAASSEKLRASAARLKARRAAGAGGGGNKGLLADLKAIQILANAQKGDIAQATAALKPALDALKAREDDVARLRQELQLVKPVGGQRPVVTERFDGPTKAAQTKAQADWDRQNPVYLEAQKNLEAAEAAYGEVKSQVDAAQGAIKAAELEQRRYEPLLSKFRERVGAQIGVPPSAVPAAPGAAPAQSDAAILQGR